MNKLAGVIVTATVVVGCGPSEVDGDWFVCLEPSCVTLDDDGVRLFEGKWATLDAPGSRLEPGEPYEARAPWGSFRYTGRTLELSAEGGEVRALSVEVDGAVVRVTAADSSDRLLLMRVGDGEPIDGAALEGAHLAPPLPGQPGRTPTPTPPPAAPGGGEEL